MARIGLSGYIERRTTGRSGRSDVNENWRNWWLVKDKTIPIATVSIPLKYLGKRVRFKMEVLDE